MAKVFDPTLRNCKITLVKTFSQAHTQRTGEVGRVEVGSHGWELTFYSMDDLVDFVEGIEPGFFDSGE